LQEASSNIYDKSTDDAAAGIDKRNNKKQGLQPG
jgi:hypothetical protein